MFHINFIGVFMICPDTQFYIPVSSDLLGCTIKQKARYRVCVVAILFFTLYKNLPIFQTSVAT
jgi:hypothetical protein